MSVIVSFALSLFSSWTDTMKWIVRLAAVIGSITVLDASAQLQPSRYPPEGLAAETRSTFAASRADRTQQPAGLGLTPQDLRVRNAALIAGGALLVGTYGMAKWWDEGFDSGFRTENEGWFGATTRSGGADKLGHALFAYAGTRLLARGFEWAGNEPGPARKLGFWSTLGIMTAVEIADGFSRQYRFSAQDFAMNVVGAGIGYLMEGSPELDRLVDLRLLYKKSADSDFDPAGDYSGQTYLLALKAGGVPTLRNHALLRYLELAVGYGTRGYESAAIADRSRNLYFGISLNVSEVLRQTVYRNDREPGRAQRSSELFFEFLQLPGTAALARHPL